MRAAALAVLLAVTVLLAAGASAQVSGRVTDAETGAPVAGAAVLARAASGTVGRATDADGRFALLGLDGRVAVTVRALGYATRDTILVVGNVPVRLDVALRPETTTAAEVVVQARRSETATRADAPVVLVPQAVTAVTARVLDGQAARDAQDALRNVPGVTIDAKGQPGGVPVLRGFATDQTGGGVRRNGTEVPYLADGLRANVARVEVLRGPASVLYGRLEPGGVVNFITETPRAERHAEAEGEAGTLGSGRLAVDVGGPVGGLSARLNASAERRGVGRDEVAATALFAAPAVRWRRPGLTLDADAEALATETTLDPGLAALGEADSGALDETPRTRFFGEPDAVHRWRSLGLFTNADWRARPGLGVRGGVSLSRYRLERGALDLLGLNRDGDVRRSLQRETLGFTYLKATAFADLQARSGPVAHAVTVGAEAIRAWAQADGRAQLSNGPGGLRFAQLDPVSLEDPTPTGIDLSDEVDYLDASVRGLDVGVFVQDRATLRVGRGALHVVGAARVSHVRFGADVRALADTPQAPAGISTRAATATAVTPSAGLVAEVRPGVALYVSTGTSFNPVVERVGRDGQPYRPTRGVQVEGGFKLDGRRAAATVSAFWIQKDDALTVGPDGFSDQTGRQRSRGLEADLRAEPFDGLTTLATVALLDAEVVEDANVAPGTALPFAPPWAASVWAEWQRGPLALRGGAWARSERSGALGGSFTLPADVTVDLGAALAVAPGVTVRLDARNALDARGYSAGRRRSGAGGVPLLVAWPTPAREVRLGVVVR